MPFSDERTQTFSGEGVKPLSDPTLFDTLNLTMIYHACKCALQCKSWLRLRSEQQLAEMAAQCCTSRISLSTGCL